jgi:hypothetical protein
VSREKKKGGGLGLGGQTHTYHSGFVETGKIDSVASLNVETP